MEATVVINRRWKPDADLVVEDVFVVTRVWVVTMELLFIFAIVHSRWLGKRLVRWDVPM